VSFSHNWGTFESTDELADAGSSEFVNVGDTATVGNQVFVCTERGPIKAPPGQERHTEALRRLGRWKSVWRPIASA
jgi:hypothetical protein